MRQRVMIAMALSCAPDVLIADEPTTALDVTIQGQILDLIAELVAESGMALIMISHDLGVIAETTERVMVMYGGAVVEEGPTDALFGDLTHPYTQGLFAAVPRLGVAEGTRLKTIPGTVPDLPDLPAGCTFSGRCPIVIDECRAAPPPLIDVGADHRAACIRIEEARRLREEAAE
jgi:peptide/nickel transport system ATP-binding protein